MVLAFCSGWYFQSLRDEAEQNKEIVREVKVNNEASASLENTTQEINSKTEILNQQLKVTYAQAGNRCLIPIDGLRILQQADR